MGEVGSSIGGIGSYAIGRANLTRQKHNLEWQQKVQRTEWAREDNAVQRRVADLRAAGLSPTLAAGQGAQAGPVVSTQAPQQEANFPEIDPATGYLALAKMKADVDRTNAEKAAVDQQRIKSQKDVELIELLKRKALAESKTMEWDLSKSKDAGQSSRPGIWGNLVRDVQGTVRHAVDAISNDQGKKLMDLDEARKKAEKLREERNRK